MISSTSSTSTRPYLIRALHEWCTDNGFTPYITVQVDETTQVPREFVKDNEIILNVSFDATGALKLGNEYIEFKGRFSGVARDIIVPINRVIAIFARENSQGMAFPNVLPGEGGSHTTASDGVPSSAGPAGSSESTNKVGKLISVETVTLTTANPDDEPEDHRPKPPSGTRPTLKRVK